MNRVSKNAFYYILANYISAGIGFASSLFVIRFVDIGTFGAFSHIRNATVFLLAFAWFGMNSIFFRILLYKTKYLLFGLILFIYLSICLLLSLLVAYIPGLYVGTLFQQYSLNHHIIAILIFTTLSLNYFDNIFLVAEKASLVAVTILLNALSSAVAAAILIYWKNINYALLFLTIFYIVEYAVIGSVYNKKVRSSITNFIHDIKDKSLVKEAIADFKQEIIFFRFFGLSNISDIVLRRIVNIYFANTGNTSSLGILAIFNQFVDILLSLGWSINNSWGINRLKMLLERWRKKENMLSLIKSFYDEFLIVNFLLITIFLISSPIWISFLSLMLRKWQISYLLFLTMIVFVVARYVVDFLSRIMLYNCLYLKEKLGAQTLVATFVSAAFIPVSFLIVKDFGIYGALATTLIPGLVVYLTSEYFVPELRFVRIKTMLISFVFFAPIAIGYIPNKIVLSAGVSLLLSVIIIGIFYLVYGRQFRKEIAGIISHFTFINRPFTALLRFRDVIISRNK